MNRRIASRVATFAAAACCLVVPWVAWGSDGSEGLDPTLVRAVEADWERQEVRRNRTTDSREAIREALDRAARARDRWQSPRSPSDNNNDDPEWTTLRDLAGRMEGASDQDRRACYRRVRWYTRQVLLRNPEVTGQPLLFLKRNRYICQMLHEYMGYFYDYGDVPPGGGVFVLDRPGVSFATRDLVQGRLPDGHFTTLALSYDGQVILFAHSQRSPRKPEFRSSQRRSFHLYRVNRDGSDLRALTDGVEDDFDPCPLPDGGIAFMSTRRGGFARCNNAWEPCASYTLHRMNADGSGIRRLSHHETSEWHPSVLNDGRLVFIRWDYVDRSAANFHGLWTCHPDGTGIAGLFGNYTMRINACYQPRPIPGSTKILFVAGAHHADVGGSLVLLDPLKTRYDPASGEDSLDAVEVLTPEVCFPESAGWPKSYFHSPWPLSEDVCLVSFSHDPLPGMSSGEGRDTRTGLYYWDRWGNLELLYRDESMSSMYPIPYRPRPAPPVLPGHLDPDLGDEGEFILTDVRRSHLPMPKDRPIRQLRVFQILPKDGQHTANQPRIGHANAENARMLLGTVPVESDGSAYFRAPAGKPLYFQAVDAEGRAVQGMRSATYLQPGERRSCIGCHEPPGSTPALTPGIAFRRRPSRLDPGPDGSRPLSYTRLVQPVLDRHCIRCHDGQTGPGRSALSLTAELEGVFSRSYHNLKPFLRWYEWGEASIRQVATHPGELGADASRLSQVLDDPDHRPHLTLTDVDRRILYLWLDANVPFYGTYSPDDQAAQRAGRLIEPPGFQ